MQCLTTSSRTSTHILGGAHVHVSPCAQTKWWLVWGLSQHGPTMITWGHIKGLNCKSGDIRIEHGEASALTLTWKGKDERKGHRLSLKAFPASFASHARTKRAKSWGWRTIIVDRVYFDIRHWIWNQVNTCRQGRNRAHQAKVALGFQISPGSNLRLTRIQNYSIHSPLPFPAPVLNMGFRVTWEPLKVETQRAGLGLRTHPV